MSETIGFGARGATTRDRSLTFLWPDDGVCGGHGWTLRPWRLRRSEPFGIARVGLVHRGDRLPFRHEFHVSALRPGNDPASRRVRCLDGSGHGTLARLLRHHRPGDPLAGGWGHGVVHRWFRGCRLRHPARSDRTGQSRLLRPAGPDRFWDRADLCPHPPRDAHYAVLGLVIFAIITMFDFQRLRRSSDVASAPLMAASIFSTS